MADNVTTKDAAGVVVPVLTDEVTTVNGGAVSAVQSQVIKVATGASGAATYVSSTNPFPVTNTTSEASLATIATNTARGTYGYASGTSAATVDVPAGARVRRVSVIAGTGANATVAIAGGATITIPAGYGFDETVPGDVTTGADVVIGGTVQSFYVSWTS